MPDLPAALIAVGELAGVLDGGVLQWEWFGDPKNKTLGAMPDNRAELGNLFRALLPNAPAQDETFQGPPDERLWVPFNFGSGQVGVGFVWDKGGPALRLGLGAKASFSVGGKTIDLGVLARMLKVQNQTIAQEFGNVLFRGSFPVPDFLSSASIDGEIPALIIALTVVDALARERKLELSSPQLAWDCLRIATFVVQAWIHQKAAQPGDDFFDRIDEHLFPMLGDPAGVIDPFPLFQPQKAVPNFDAWKDSVLSSDDNFGGALTFLWHLRALLTGNESSDFLGGSFIFPLAGNPSSGNPPTLANQTGTFDPNLNATGAWVGMSDSFELFVELRRQGASTPTVCHIPIAQLNGGVLNRPTITGGLLSEVANILSTPLPIGSGGLQITATPDGKRVTLFNQPLTGTNIPGFDGNYALHLDLAANAPIAFSVSTPFIELPLPPPAAVPDLHKIVGAVVPLVLKAIPAPPGDPLPPVMHALGTFIHDRLTTGSANPLPVLMSVVGAFAADVKIDAGPVTITFPGGHFHPLLAIGPIEAGNEENPAFHIGKLTAEADVVLTTGQLTSAKVAIVDFRLGEIEGVSDGLVGSLFPDLRESEGFSLSVDVVNGTVEGGGKIPIQKSLGPVELAALLVDVRPASFTLGVDLSFELGPIQVAVFELGIRFFFKDDSGHSAGDIEPFLHGLGVSMDAEAVKLAGMFAEVKLAGGGSDYVGGAVVSVVDYFELSAIGGYAQVEGKSSLFIFASLVAPLGGPPYCFITGIAGGFGYNRLLPPPGLLSEHPFLQVMSGELNLTGGASNQLIALSGAFAFSLGNHWVAAGIQFRSFGFIEGKVVIAAQFGHSFCFQLLGLAAFGISPIAYFELAIEARADAESFQLKAGLSPNSYVIHPDIFSLRGDFALAVFYGGPDAGDFVLSIGGYHPYFPVPAHYPTLNRVGVKATVFGFVRLSVEVFFACTPQALMAGASISLSAEFEGIGAGLDVYIDVFIQWDPFFIQGRMGVCLWFEFCGRHEISVELEIHTPRLGGTAVIDLALVSFEVDFGHQLDDGGGPPLHEFITRQLGVPATKFGGEGAKVAAFNTADAAGLLRFDFVEGRTDKEKQSASSAQEGVSTPVPVTSEFKFAVRTRLPLDEPGTITDSSPPPPLPLIGEVNLPLCGKGPLSSDLTITATNIAKARRTRLLDLFPAASFGSKLEIANADNDGARQAVAKLDTGEAAVSLSDGIEFHYEAERTPSDANALTLEPEEISLAEEDYPLPLGGPQKYRMPKFALAYSDAPLVFKLPAKTLVLSRREVALQVRQNRVLPPLVVTALTGELQRVLKLALGSASTVVRPPAGAKVIAMPASPARRAELLGVNLRILPAQTPVALRSKPIETLSRARILERRTLTPRTGAKGNFSGEVSVEAGQAAALDLAGGKPIRSAVAVAGQQIVRAIFLSAHEEPLADLYVAGAASLAAPVHARRAVFIGEGLEAPVTVPAKAARKAKTAPTRAVAAPPPTARERVGLEHDSVLLALSRRVFAGHGCVFEAIARPGFAAQPLDSVPGHELLRNVTRFRLHFPAAPKAWSLVLTVESLVAQPGSALEEIRWRSAQAKFANLRTVIAPDRVALIMDVLAPQPWKLDVDFGRKWRCAGAVLREGAARKVAVKFGARLSWDQLDDRFVPAARTSSKVTVQIFQ